MLLNGGSCGNITDIIVRSGPGMSIFFFVAAVAGNLLALFILGVAQRRRSSKPSAFCILVTGLVVTDLLGTCLLSPPVFVCYAQQQSLLGLTGDRSLCDLFGFAMTFFGLAPMFILTAMAVERCLAVCRPYLYEQLARRFFTRLALLLIYLFSAAFCLLPFAGVGRHRQYCPGTWCFIDMSGGRGGAAGLAFSLSYSSLMALLIGVVFVCNGAVIVALCRMHRSQRTRRGSVVSGRGAGSRRRALGWFGQGEEELDHLMLLASMTLIFVVCSLPLTIAGFINAVRPLADDEGNLTAFRFHAFNPIVDPWVFIICRKSVLRHFYLLLRCRLARCGVRTAAASAPSCTPARSQHLGGPDPAGRPLTEGSPPGPGSRC
ncbi:prostacyclin receptor [Gadus chalcogrammus]|uniref:prostacyclin receptor n=1 Tax=Gadus chalcogrammus TaxID=1042646 RepID=UPI0024C49282|nr:prostacyclin receptor [Gadus chalcogrammus]XP_056468049.1 prostacyclin receptor [Gadus chalcogrammus]